MCPPNEWSCGDGQYISNRLGFLKTSALELCGSRRDQYYMCEAHVSDRLWTLPNGRCILINKYDELKVENSTHSEKCQFLLKCGFYYGTEKRCPCGGVSPCFSHQDNSCSAEPIEYPKGGLISPYIVYLYSRKIAWYEVKKIPDLFRINGTIKCREFSIDIIHQGSFEFLLTLRELESVLCTSIQEGSVLGNNGYDQHCNYRSRTFNNHSYHFIDVCNKSRECISAYRIRDGICNCVADMDEIQDQHLSDACSNIQRYRFRCSVKESTCLSVTVLGNGKENCKNKFDEVWMGGSRKLSDLSCNSRSKEDCDSLRQYIETWVLDGEWDCSDASDEEAVLDLFISDSNLKVVQLDELEKRFATLEKIPPFATICNVSSEFPCLRIDVSDPIPNLTTNRPGIDIDQIGDGYVDCYGGIDERNTLEYCDHVTMLGYYFKCLSSNRCIEYTQICNHNHKCVNISDTGFWCDHQDTVLSSTGCYGMRDFKCFNGTCVRKDQCNRIVECSFGEDEYMCDDQFLSVSRSVPYRKEKELITQNTQQRLQLHRFPSDINTTIPANDVIITREQTTMMFPDHNTSLTMVINVNSIAIE